MKCLTGMTVYIPLILCISCIYSYIHRRRTGCQRKMEIVISNSSGKPIYEQITDQVKSQIMSGQLKAGDALPSMRALAQSLRISLITTKRAYNDLEAEGFIETVAGKGSFVAAQDPQLLREANLRLAEESIRRAVEVAKRGGITREELTEMVDILYESD